MKKLSTEQIRTGLRKPGAAPVPGADEFWSDFKARARLRNQEQPVEAPVMSISGGWAMALAACAVLTLAGYGLVLFLGGSEPRAPEIQAAESRAPEIQDRELSSVKSLDVEVAHSAVLVMNDELDQGTIVWIVDMQTDDNNEGKGV